MGLRRESEVDYWLTEDGLLLLEAWSRDGCEIQEIAEKIGITRQALDKWRKKYPEIGKAVQVGRELTDYKVENALLKSALGYTTKEIKVTVGKKIFNGETVELLKETTTREIAPNVSAIMFWLNNRNHDKWKKNRDKLMDLDEEDNNISITIVRGPKNDELGDEVNQEVKLETDNKKPKQENKQVEEAEEVNEDEWEGWEDWDDEEIEE